MAEARMNEIQNIRKEYGWFYPLVGGLTLLAIGFLIGAAVFQGEDQGFGYMTNLYTELISIGVTIIILDRMNEARATQRLKKRLIREASSLSNETAKVAIDGMRHEGWLIGQNSILEGVDLSGSHLATANLRGANLKGATLRAILRQAWLSGSNLEGANLYGAYLEGAELQSANLKDAYLNSANLNGANLEQANLTGANLEFARLRGTYLEGANLERANLRRTILPDGRRGGRRSDMRRYTDRDDPEFEATLKRVNKHRTSLKNEPDN